MDAVQPFTALSTPYSITRGTWVNFSRPRGINLKGPKCRHGCVRLVLEDACATVIDERTFTDVREDMYSEEG
jgi:hypothetical protein